jgi:hypothetical protein
MMKIVNVVSVVVVIVSGYNTIVRSLFEVQFECDSLGGIDVSHLLIHFKCFLQV